MTRCTSSDNAWGTGDIYVTIVENNSLTIHITIDIWIISYCLRNQVVLILLEDCLYSCDNRYVT
jgi:hypothetical protein